MKKLLLFVAAIIFAAQAYSANTATITLNGTTYSTIALAIAASTSESDVINISAGTVSEKVTFTKPLTINGAGMGLTTISPPTSTVVVTSNTSFSAATSVTLSNLTISGGSSTTSGGGMAFNVTSGTGLLTVNLTNLKITSNTSTSTTGGGGIYTSGQVALNINGCYITGNTSSGTGGGVYVNPGTGFQANLTIKNSTIATNTSSSNGGGVAVNCGNNVSNTSMVNSLWIENSTILGNNVTTSAKIGGGVYYKTCASSGNTAHTNRITLNHCTIVNNTTNFGATSSTLAGPDGVGVENSGGWSTTLVMNNSVIMGNTGSTGSYNCQVGSNNTVNLPATNGKITNGGISNCIFNPIAGATWVTAETTNNKLDAVLGDLAFAGSLSTDATPVLKFGESSIARNYVASNLLLPALTTDQIGNERVGHTDAGAYEFPNYIISGTTNAADIVCTTCDVTVASGGELTVGATKTLKSVTVAAGGKITISAGTLTATSGITLQSSAAGTATMLNSGTYVGTINAEQYLGSARNWYVSSPVSNAPSPSSNMDYYYEYVEAGTNNPAGQPGSSTAYWKGLANGTTMEVGKGYIAKSNAGGTVQFSGTPNNGDITTAFNLTRNDTKGKGFNLVGNPYPSYLDWVDVAAANPNLDNTYYYRTKNSASGYTFVTWNGAGSNYVVSNGSLPVNTTVTRYIPPTQAFWVRVKSNTSSTAMNFTNTMREHRDDNGNLMKAKRQDTRIGVRLQLQNGSETDELLIYQDEAASNSYDAFDSPKMMNNSSIVPDLYSKVGDERLVINGLNAITDNTEMPLGFSLNAAASLKLKATEMCNFPIGTRLYLLDKVKSTQVELLPETEYAFKTTTATTNNESRFSLLLRAPGASTGIEKTEKGNIQVFVNEANQITIIAPIKSNYAIYNAVGQLIENGVINTKRETRNTKQKAAGVYVVKVNNQSTRVIIK